MTQRVKYKQGDPVRLTPGSERLSSRLAAGEEGVHTGEVSNNGYEIVDFPNQRHVYTTQNEIEPVKFDVDSVAKEFGVDLSEPDTLDPALVKAGDTVTLESGTAVVTDVVIEAKSRGQGQFVFYTSESPDPLIPGTYYLVNPGAWTLTVHQPAPEPEPEWNLSDVVSARLRNESIPDRFWYVDEGDTVKPYFVDDVGVKHSPDDLHDIRPLVVIDPADERLDQDSLAEVARTAYNSASDVVEWETVANAIRAHLGIGD